MVPSNNLASPSIYETAQQEFDQEIEEEKFKEFNKLLQDPAPIFDSGSNQHPGIQLCSENALPVVSEHLAGSFTASTAAQPSIIDTGEQLAQLVAALDPSVTLVSNQGWSDPKAETIICNQEQPENAIRKTWEPPVQDNYEELMKLVATLDPSVALIPDHGWPLLDTTENTINSSRESSCTTHQVNSNQTVTLTLPVVNATSLDSPRHPQLAMPVQANISPEINKGMITTTTARSDVVNHPGSRPITKEAASRPSVIVQARPRKRAFKEVGGYSLPTANKTHSLAENENQDEILAAVLEKRRKEGNARCQKYRVKK